MSVHRREHAEFWLQEAYRAQLQGDLPKAAELYKKSIGLFALPEAHTFLGWTYSFMGRLQDAIDECHKAIAIDPAYGNPHNDIGAYLIELGKLDEAVPYLNQAIQAQRYDARHYPHFNLSRIWLQKGRLGEAIRELEEAVRLCPDYPAALKELARLREEESRRARAQQPPPSPPQAQEHPGARNP
jgi:Tfp pilus assembly protein PilF